MKFVYPGLLMLVILVPLAGLVWIWIRSRAQRKIKGLVATRLASRLMPAMERFFPVQAALVISGLMLVLFAAARPQWGRSMQHIEQKSRNVVVALDVSRSMLAKDVNPNRLERAKADVSDLIEGLNGDRCAIVAFRHKAVAVCPLTSDYGFLRGALESVDVDSAPRGETDLGDAIRESLEVLNKDEDDHNAIILISDGGDLKGDALGAAKEAKKRNVPVFTVGIGNPSRDSVIPDAEGKGNQKYKDGDVKTRLEDGTLSAIAKASGGRYVPLATAGMVDTTMASIYRQFLRKVAAKEQADEEEQRATERFGIFLVPGLVLLMLAAMLSRGRFAAKCRRKVNVSAVMFAVMTLFSFAMPAEVMKAVPYRGAIAINAANGAVLFADNENAKAYPASCTKLMTALLVLEDMRAGLYKPRDMAYGSVTATRVEPSIVGIKPGQSMTVDDLLTSIMVKSANDAAIVLAENSSAHRAGRAKPASGDLAAFIERMNAKAKTLKMISTVYVTPNGLNPNKFNMKRGYDVSTAADLAKLGRELVTKYPEIFRYTTQKIAKVRDGDGKELSFVNHNNILVKDKQKILNSRGESEVDGLKTGFLTAAGSSIVLSGKRGKGRAIVVVVGSDGSKVRDERARKLMVDALGAVAR